MTTLNAPDGDLVPALVVTGTEAIRQRLVQRARCHRGEWYLDTSIGVPYLEEVLRRPPLAGAVVAAELERVPEVDRVTDITFEPVQRDERRYRLRFVAHTTAGAIPVTTT